MNNHKDVKSSYPILIVLLVMIIYSASTGCDRSRSRPGAGREQAGAGQDLIGSGAGVNQERVGSQPGARRESRGYFILLYFYFTKCFIIGNRKNM